MTEHQRNSAGCLLLVTLCLHYIFFKNMDNKDVFELQSCPICNREFPSSEIQSHVNRCIFLNSTDEESKQKRKRSSSPLLRNKQKSPIIHTSTTNSTEEHEITFNSTSNPNSSKASVDYSFTVPLAAQVQPKTLQEFYGQNHILGQNTILRNLLERNEIPNMILWGPPGCGKTSLSNVIKHICKANNKHYRFVGMCAANCGVKEVQTIVTAAKGDLKFGKKTILFMDEIHRFNKRQQDTFLLHVEKGEIVLVGATTENPSFTINNALLSRCRVIVMEKLETTDLMALIQRAVKALNIEIVSGNSSHWQQSDGLAIDEPAIEWLADTSDGDARIALSNLQMVIQYYNNTNKLLSVEDIKNGIKKSHLLYDRKGEEHYNIISAMHKSIRGSDDNAALYWTTRMIVSGEDPLFVARRMVRAASEDIGNADPSALSLAISTMQGCQLLGKPECDVLLAQCAIYLARAPKSREADSALQEAKRVIAECQGPQPSVPMHLRNAPTRLMKDLGYGKLANGAERTYMPEGLENADFF